MGENGELSARLQKRRGGRSEQRGRARRPQGVGGPSVLGSDGGSTTRARTEVMPEHSARRVHSRTLPRHLSPANFLLMRIGLQLSFSER